MLSVRAIVNTRLHEKLRKDEGAPYTEETLNMTSTRNGTPASFPTLNVDSLGEPSTSDCLKGNKQCAIISTIELKTYSNDTLKLGIRSVSAFLQEGSENPRVRKNGRELKKKRQR